MTRERPPEIDKLLRDIEWELDLTKKEIGKDRFDPRVMEAITAVPRHEFVPEESRRYAYDDGPLPIGFGQTVSQPFIVALMTDLLEPKPKDVVLEVGTGSGYQTAILARLVKKVYSVEIIGVLAEQACERLRKLGIDNVEIKVGDGYYGWPEHAPYDKIIVTAAAPEIPPPLIEQLKPGGRLVIPVGEPFGYQMLKVVDKDNSGRLETRDVLGVAFVPLTGDGVEKNGRDDTGTTHNPTP
ncbi:protein-L-isoaspartate(D-aspartate) O-methyltransferase [Methylomarinovum tepidoasis]|uniref:protein-L-isoaspartate(D-aspartate) O-methyltransferase n=1 Tax=Methylomarinovum tepidoasis TaxID=2840183 RepID=UPI0025742C69|nr:protein-L-isoaspartate(D-aspartate) O-methyltransferase [Methylomarinovum sp. IN45]